MSMVIDIDNLFYFKLIFEEIERWNRENRENGLRVFIIMEFSMVEINS